MLENSAWRDADFRPNFRPDFWWRMARFLYLSLRFAAQRGRHPAVELHAERQAHLGENFFDLLERLAPKVLRLEHLGLGLLHQLADVTDVGVLQAVGRAHRQ